MKASTRDSKFVLAVQLRERRLAGDQRPALVIVFELLNEISGPEAKRALALEIVQKAGRLMRRDASGTPETDVQASLFPEEDLANYRTPPLVRVRRDGREDFMRHDVVPYGEINKHDAWDLSQANRIRAYRKQRKQHNAATSQHLTVLGFDPARHTIHDIRAQGDPRVCALCGEGPVAGDPMELDHETPVAIGGGAGRLDWAHQSCNRSKGSTPVDHLTPKNI